MHSDGVLSIQSIFVISNTCNDLYMPSSYSNIESRFRGVNVAEGHDIFDYKDGNLKRISALLH